MTLVRSAPQSSHVLAEALRGHELAQRRGDLVGLVLVHADRLQDAEDADLAECAGSPPAHQPHRNRAARGKILLL